jgi:multidrug efflux pump subunit AcrA (membrane-fusion protein)
MRRFVPTLSLALALACAEHKTESAAKPPPPATVRLISETGLGEVTLTPDARARLGLETVPLETAPTRRQRLLAGEVLLALGESSSEGSRAGSIYSLVPPRSAGDLERVADLQLAADGAVEVASIASDAAREALQRAEALLESRAGSGRSVEEARIRLAQADATLRNARQRRRLLGASVFDAVGTRKVWVRVEAYGGETRLLDLEATASFRALGAPTGESLGKLRPVRATISAASTGATTDLFYEPTESGSALRPGERVTVMVPLRETADALLAPLSAVVRDAHGGAWIYEETSTNTFVRKRIEIRDAQSGTVTLLAGPSPGARIVSAGAAELFGTELGFAK